MIKGSRARRLFRAWRELADWLIGCMIVSEVEVRGRTAGGNTGAVWLAGMDCPCRELLVSLVRLGIGWVH